MGGDKKSYAIGGIIAARHGKGPEASGDPRDVGLGVVPALRHAGGVPRGRIWR